MNNMSVYVAAGAFCLALSAGVSAEEKGRPCVADAERLCKGVQQGEGRVAQCLKEHANELSPACKKNIGKTKERVREVAEACKDDAARVCKDTKPGKGRMLRCLKLHEHELSAVCREQMTLPHTRN